MKKALAGAGLMVALSHCSTRQANLRATADGAPLVDASAPVRNPGAASEPLSPPLDASRSDATNVDAAPPRCAPPAGPFEAFFRVGSTQRYRIIDTVDAHSTDGARERTTLEATFRVTAVDCDDGAWVANGSWAVEGDTAIATRLPDEWRLTGGVLTETAGGASFADAKMAKPKGAPCHVTSDRGPYGKTLRRVCIDRAGLVSVREENMHGPRVLEVTRR
ncbi:MAG: hypothetical protein IPG50_13785 [Myxococcales bacterium]|nr:hypothetical protein [Myxococcales bacterium]